MNIPAEAVEAAEHAFKECLRSQHIPVDASWAEELRVAIEAAMPYLVSDMPGEDFYVRLDNSAQIA